MVSRGHGPDVIVVGTCGFGGSRARAFRDLEAVEIQETFDRRLDRDRARAWRDESPGDFTFTVKASHFITHDASSLTLRRAVRRIPDEERAAYGGFQATRAVREGWETTLAAAEALRAKAIVFETPATFGPTEANRDALYRFFESIATPATKVIELQGPWASHLVERVCEDLGLVHAVDPFAKEPATYGTAYFRLHGIPPGLSRSGSSYSDSDFGKLHTVCNEYDDAYVMFGNPTMHDDAARFGRFLGRDAVGSSGAK